MDFKNPPAAHESSHKVKIICVGLPRSSQVLYSFSSHLSAALRREGFSSFVNTSQFEPTSFSGDRNQTVYVVLRLGVGNHSWSWSHNSDYSIKVIKPWRDKSISMVSYEFYDSSHGRICSKSSQEAGNLTWFYRERIFTDSELVEEIVKDVYVKLYSGERVGIYSRLLEIDNLLYKQEGDIRSIGIWGMPGIGKTTLAKAVFNHMSTDYDASCFIQNFDEVFHKEGLHRLLEEKIGKLLEEEFDIKSSYILRPSLLREKLCDKKIFIVLDDVRDSLAAESFLGRLDWFGPGSVIVMTSIDKQVFAFCQTNHIYELQGLNEQEALQLFSQNAFGKDVPEENDRELSRKVIDYANGNPLALSIYGRELMGYKSETEVAFLKLKQCPPQKIQDMRKNVYSSLDDNEKNIFLDIASLFKGENVNDVVQMLEGFRYLPRIGIDVLVDKCVLTISSEDTVQMNSLIQDICLVIFNGEIESCTRMWEPSSIRYLLEDDELKATGESSATPKCGLVIEDIESIILNTSNLKFDVKHDAFKNMFNLRFLKIYSSSSKYVIGLNFPKGLDSLPCGLRFIHWENYPLQSLPQDFDLENLVELCMPYSQLQSLGTGTKNLKMLKRIRLRHSQQLVEFDIILTAQNIELIDLQDCTRLRNFPDTSQLQHLRVVNLSGCTEITGFQGAPPNIEELHLQGTSIKEIPISIVSHSTKKVKLDRQKLLNLLENFQDVEHIDLESVTDLVKVSSYNQGFGKLVHLNMKDCSHLKSLPDMVSLESLQVLHLSGCSELKEIKGFPRNMIKLYLGGTAIREVPQLPKSLEVLNAHSSTYLKSVSLDFEKLPRHYIFSNCFNFSSQVIVEFFENGMARVASLARAQQQEVIKAPEVIICIPADARQRSSFLLQEGPNVTIDLAPWTQTPLFGFVMSVVVSFRDDYHNTVGLGIRCRCTWEDRFNSKIFQCWAPREAPNVEWDHIFILYDTQMHPSGSAGSEVQFEFETVSWENELLGDNCKVTQCDVQIITAPTFDAIPSEITRESEATSIIEEHPPTSSRVLEAKIPNPLSSSEPRKVSSVRSKLRSTGTMFWKWVKTIRRVNKKKTLTNSEQEDVRLGFTTTTIYNRNPPR